MNKYQKIKDFFLKKREHLGETRAKCRGCCTGAAKPSRERSTSGMQGWIIAWRYVGVWFPQRPCTEVYNPLRTTAGSWRRAHIHIGVGGSKVEQPSQSWADATYAGSFKKPHEKRSLQLLAALENAQICDLG